jgi:hypothetical protein
MEVGSPSEKPRAECETARAVQVEKPPLDWL